MAEPRVHSGEESLAKSAKQVLDSNGGQDALKAFQHELFDHLYSPNANNLVESSKDSTKETKETFSHIIEDVGTFKSNPLSPSNSKSERVSDAQRPDYAKELRKNGDFNAYGYDGVICFSKDQSVDLSKANGGLVQDKNSFCAWTSGVISGNDASGKEYSVLEFPEEDLYNGKSKAPRPERQ